MKIESIKYLNAWAAFFDRNLIVEKISDRHWRTYVEFNYTLDNGVVITVPEGFITDFASIPRVFWIFLPPDGIYTQSAVLHDYLYNRKLYTRDFCDKLFLEAMEVLKVKKYIRNIMYYAVRAFGWIPWNFGKKS